MKLITYIGSAVICFGLGMASNLPVIGICTALAGALILFSSWEGAGSVISAAGEYLEESFASAKTKASASATTSSNWAFKMPEMPEMTFEGVLWVSLVATIALMLITTIFFEPTLFQITLGVLVIAALGVTLAEKWGFIMDTCEKVALRVLESPFTLIYKGLSKSTMTMLVTVFILSLMAGIGAGFLSEEFPGQTWRKVAEYSFMVAMSMSGSIIIFAAAKRVMAKKKK